jgi:hypothetical protein
MGLVADLTRWHLIMRTLFQVQRLQDIRMDFLCNYLAIKF